MAEKIEFGPCTFRCAATGKELIPGEEVYSVLLQEGGKCARQDFSPEGWTGPPENAIAWWRTTVPQKPSAGGRTTRPVGIFEEFSEILRSGEPPEFAYLLALFLLRRKILRFEGEINDSQDRKVLLLSHPKSGATFQVPVAVPDPTRWPMMELALTQFFGIGSQKTPEMEKPNAPGGPERRSPG
jgi:hypothetical protein